MMEQNTKKKMSTKKKVLIIIAVIVGILVVCWGGYEIYANKVPEYNQNTTGMIYGNDKEDTLDEQQYNGFKKIVQEAIQQKCSDVNTRMTALRLPSQVTTHMKSLGDVKNKVKGIQQW